MMKFGSSKEYIDIYRDKNQHFFWVGEKGKKSLMVKEKKQFKGKKKK